MDRNSRKPPLLPGSIPRAFSRGFMFPNPRSFVFICIPRNKSSYLSKRVPGSHLAQIIFAGLIIGLLLFTGPAQARQADDKPGGEAKVTGRVMDQSGAALPRVSVQVFDSSGKQIAATLTNGIGEFALELPAGSYTMEAALAGFVPLRDRILEVSRNMPPLTLSLEIPSVEQQILVTATRTEAPLSQVGAGTTIITAQQLSREGIASVAEALRRVVGVSLVASGGTGQVASLFVRGGESKYTKVLIDGIPLNEPGGSYNYANMSTTDVERIELVRGPQSALFGSDAIAGVIQIFTKRGSGEGLSPVPRFLIEGGTFAGYRYAAGVSGKSKSLDYAASFSRSDTDNNVINGSFNEETISGNFGFFLSRNSEIRAVFRSEAGRTGVPGQWAFQRPDPDEYYRHRDIAGGLSFTQQITTAWTQRLVYNVSDSRQFSEDPSDSGMTLPSYGGRTAPYTSFDFAFQTLNQTRRQRAGYQSDIALPRGHLLTAGADYEHESGTIGNPQSSPLRAVRDNYGAFLQDQWAFRNRVFTTAGVRFEDNASFGFYAVPRFSAALHVHQPKAGGVWGLTKLKGNFGLGIKEPTLIESYSQSPYFRGNPNLEAEESISFDAGLEQHAGSDRTILEVTYFDSRFRNQIGFVTTNYQTYEGTFFNLGRTRARGVEGSLRQDLGKGLVISGAYTFLDSRVLESASDFDPVFAKGQALLRRPRHSAFVDLRWKPGRWVLGATGLLVGSRLDSDFAGLGLNRNPGYGILNLLLNYRLTESMSIFAAVNNALDKGYMEVLGYPGLRANFRIGLRAGF